MLTINQRKGSARGGNVMEWPSGPCERLARVTVTSTMRRAAHPSGCARCGAGAGCSAIEYEYL